MIKKYRVFALVYITSFLISILYTEPFGLNFINWNGVSLVLVLGGYYIGYTLTRLRSLKSDRKKAGLIAGGIIIYLLTLFAYNLMIAKGYPSFQTNAILVVLYSILVLLTSALLGVLGISLEEAPKGKGP